MPRAAAQFAALSPREDPSPGKSSLHLAEAQKWLGREPSAASCPLWARRPGIRGPEPRLSPEPAGGGAKRTAIWGFAERSPTPRGVLQPRFADWKPRRTAATDCGPTLSLLEAGSAMTAGLSKGITWVSSVKLSPSREPF